MIVQEPVQAAIWHCLNHYAYGDATFLAERLCAEVETDETLYLLATCYYRSGKFGQAYSLLKGKGAGSSRSAQCRFLLAKCCLDLGHLEEAESVFRGCGGLGSSGAGDGGGDGMMTPETPVTPTSMSSGIGPPSLDEVVSAFGDSSCFALQLLARIFVQSEKVSKAAEAYRRALKLNPFLWSAFEALCNLGEKPDPLRTFQVSHLDSFSMCHGSNTVVNLVNSQGLDNLLPTPVPPPPSQTPMPPTSVSTPISSMIPGDGGMNPMIYSTPVHNVCAVSIPLPLIGSGIKSEDTPVGMRTPNHPPPPPPLPPAAQRCQGRTSSSTKPVKYVSVFNAPLPISPLTPSFGVLPLDSSGGESMSSTFAFLTPPVFPWHALNADSTAVTKRSKSVFSQSCNTSNSAPPPPTSQQSQGQGQEQQAPPPPPPLQPTLNVRRSSRLFTNNSVKENNKSPGGGRSKLSSIPKSPSSRKSKSRVTRSFQQLNERNKAETNVMTTPTTNNNANVVGGGGGGNNNNPTTGNPSVLAPESKVAAQLIFNKSMQPTLCKHALSMQKQSAEGLMQLLRELGAAKLHLSQFELKRAVECLKSVSGKQGRTAWVLSQLGKAYLEMGEYENACRHFSRVREKEHHRTDLIEYYSTALWHLQKEVALSALAHDLLALDRGSAAAWCAAGNCFSLQKEHDAAIRFFQRAVQVQPNFAYAYTLLGHEYVTNEELDKAMSCFRNAVRLDSRHYNAWYGVGMIYYKQEKYQMAEVYFRRALQINPQSSVLMCHMGVVQHALQKTERALQTLDAAIANHPRNPLCKFHRASIYFAVDRHLDALKELEELKEMVPKESLVYFLMGKVHNKLGNTHLALLNFSCAMDLDPKGANSHIKEAIDPAINRQQEEMAAAAASTTPTPTAPSNAAEAGDEFASEGSSLPAQESSSQESLEFPMLQGLQSDDSL